MNKTRKSLTTLGIAAALAIGGIAVAQTSGTTDSSAGTMGSGATASSTDTTGSTTTTTTTDTTTMNNSTTTTETGRVAQMDRN